MVEQGVVEDPSFSFLFSKHPGQEGSKLVLGGVNMDYAEGAFKYYPLIAHNYWKIKLDKVQVADNQMEDLAAVIDTGTSVIVGPKYLIDPLIQHLPTTPGCDTLD